MHFEKNVSTQQREEEKNLWFSVQDEHKSWETCIKQKEKKRKAEVSGLTTGHLCSMLNDPEQSLCMKPLTHEEILPWQGGKAA